MAKHKSKQREPKTSMLPITFDEALEIEIIEVMSNWPADMDRALRGAELAEGLDDPEAGHRLWEAKFEHALANSENPDTLPTIVYLAEQGHVAAQRVLQRYLNTLLEDGEAKLPSSVRTYLGRLVNGLIPAHPEDSSDVINHLFRNIGIAVMVDAAVKRWSLPKLNSSQGRHSAAYFVALVMTGYGIKLGEQQVRRIYRDHAKLAARMNKFLTGGRDQAF